MHMRRDVHFFDRGPYGVPLGLITFLFFLPPRPEIVSFLTGVYRYFNGHGRNAFDRSNKEKRKTERLFFL